MFWYISFYYLQFFSFTWPQVVECSYFTEAFPTLYGLSILKTLGFLYPVYNILHYFSIELYIGVIAIDFSPSLSLFYPIRLKILEASILFSFLSLPPPQKKSLKGDFSRRPLRDIMLFTKLWPYQIHYCMCYIGIV